MPLVSVGMPVRNGEHFVGEAIESILAQECSDFELIISDNASLDGTEDICRGYAKADRRVTYSRLSQNMGLAYNFNRVFRLSSGRYFKWAAHDDVLHPHFVTACVSAYESLAGAATIVYPKAEIIDENGKIIGPDYSTHAEADHVGKRAIQALRSMAPAAVFGLFDSDKLRNTNLHGNFIASDYALLLQSAFLGKIIQLDGEPLFKRRFHPRMSRMANTTKDELLRFFDPNAQSRLTERERLYMEYLKCPYAVRGLGQFERNTLAAMIACELGRIEIVNLLKRLARPIMPAAVYEWIKLRAPKDRG